MMGRGSFFAAYWRAWAAGAVVAAVLIATPARSDDKPVPGEDQAIDLAFRLIRERHLLPDDYQQCFSLMVDSDDAREIAVVTARESHKPQPPQCDGDPGIAPRLFTMEIDMRTGAAKWDRMTEDDVSGEMRPIPPR